jgi:hypothetical protein
MFRVVSEFVENPFYMLLCDDPRCSTMLQHPLPEPVSNREVPIANPEGEALKAAQTEGWLISVGRQICPGHAKQLRDIIQLMKQKDRDRSLIVVPRNPHNPLLTGRP